MQTNKVLFAVVFVLFSFSAFSQNWTPVNAGDEYHYELVGDTTGYDSVYVGNGNSFRYNSPVNATVWIDSTQINSGETIYHLNKIVKSCDTCTTTIPLYLRNQQQFLQHKMILDNAGKYIFEGDEKWTVFPQATTGTSWLFDTLNVITADVIAVEEDQIFGNTDSLKTILLSNNDTLVLSKEHGIVRLPDLSNNTYQNLVGIQTRELGFSIPGFQEIHDFGLGDVLQYYYSYGALDWGYEGHAKFYIQGKQVWPDSVRYDVRRIRSHVDILWGVYDTTLTDVQFSHTFYKNDVADQYPRHLFEDDMLCQWDGKWGVEQSGCTRFGFPLENKHFTTHYGQNQDDEWVKFMFAMDFSGNDNISDFYNDDPNLDILAPDPCFGGGYLYQRIWEEGLGETSFIFSCFEGYGIRELEGYIIDGDTTGIITPDAVLILSNENIALQTIEDIEIYPNPASDYITFKINAVQAISELDLTIYDTMGKALKTENYAASTSGELQVSDLPPGMYLLSFKMDGQVFTQKFVKVE